MKHELKIFPEHYRRVAAGTKTFEIRKNDRVFQKGDEVQLFAYHPEHSYLNEKEFPPLSYRIGDVYPIDSERVVFGLLPMEPK
jgi:hypothetical protein